VFKKVPGARKEKTKTIDIITEESVHVCTDECFKPRKKRKPRGLQKVSLGHIYQDEEGSFYHEWGDGDWLEITGVTFLGASKGKVHLMFEPKEQLHIHSPGGKTIAQTTKQRNSRKDYDYYSEEAAKKLKRKGYNRGESLKKISSKVSEVIPKAPKRKKPVKGTGHGALGVPRTPLTKEIVRLINQDKSKKQVLSEVTEWAKNNSISVAGPHKIKIKKQVDRWWTKIKSTQN
jgi:hypothetical protein